MQTKRQKSPFCTLQTTTYLLRYHQIPHDQSRQSPFNTNTNNLQLFIQYEHDKLSCLIEFGLIWKDQNNNLPWHDHYFDTNQSRCIWEVNSHQFKSNSITRDTKSRHPLLTPNLAILNMNHWADSCATKAITHPLGKKTGNIQHPTSDLCFFFEHNALSMDKAVTTHIHKILQKELHHWISTKDTQGFLFHIAHLCGITLKNLGDTSSFRTYLLELGFTHKSSISIQRILSSHPLHSRKYINQHQKQFPQQTGQQKHLTNHTSNDPTLHMVPPTTTATTKKACKGNRCHHFLFCTHPNLLKCCTKANTIIKNKLKILFLFPNHTTPSGGPKLLKAISEHLLCIQALNIGRNLPQNTNTNTNNLLSTEEWLIYFNISTIEEGMQSKINILSHMAGFNTALPNGDLLNNKMGLGDWIYLGLIPTTLTTQFNNTVTS